MQANLACLSNLITRPPGTMERKLLIDIAETRDTYDKMKMMI